MKMLFRGASADPITVIVRPLPPYFPHSRLDVYLLPRLLSSAPISMNNNTAELESLGE